MSQFKSSAITYIAGYAVRMVERRLACQVCLASLTSDTTDHIPFVAFKDRGGLKKPSKSTVAVCTATDMVIDHMTKGGSHVSATHRLDAIPIIVLNRVCQDHIFMDLQGHMLDCSPEDNHVFILIKLLASAYAKIKLHHVAKRLTDNSNPVNVRRKYTKLILFKNQ